MSDAHKSRTYGPYDVAADLVGYLIVVMPDLGSLAKLVPEFAELVETGVLRILDVVVLGRNKDGAVEVFEPESVESMKALADVEGDVGGLLSDRDIELASVAIRPGTVGVVLVAEDRWAQPLAAAAGRVGGQIVAGERVPAARVKAVLAESSPRNGEEG